MLKSTGKNVKNGLFCRIKKKMVSLPPIYLNHSDLIIFFLIKLIYYYAEI
jgi:hypothetical protein